MKYRKLLASLALVFFFLAIRTSAQLPPDYCKKVEDIALQERLNHERMANRGELILSSNNFDVKYYRLEWEVDPAINYLTGKVTAYYTILSSGNSITFDLTNGFTVDSVKQRNTQLAKLYTNNTLQVTFPSNVNAGVFDSVSIYYKGIPPPTGFGSFVQSTHAGVPIIWTLSEPYGSRDWWPCKNGLDDKADSIDVYVTAPAAYKAASNGLLQSETLISGNTKKISWWKHRYPIASYLICFAVTNYSVLNHMVQLGAVNMPMQTFCYPESLTQFQNNTPLVLSQLQFYHNLFGDYPFIKEKYGHVQFSWGGGMEHQTSTFVVNAGESLMAHELGHQWFGDKITCGSWVDIWLNEGFATFLDNVNAEAVHPISAILNRKNEVDYITSQPGGSVKVDDTTNVGRIFSGRLSYSKGSHVLYMLRWKLGDSVFFRALRRYQKDPKLAYGFARTDDLKRNLEEESGQDLAEFFNDWYAGQGFPTYNVQWTPLGTSYVKIKMNQVTSHPSVNFFELPVALKFKKGTQEKTILVDNKTNGEIFLRNIGFRPDTVIVDPDYWLISRANGSQKIDDAVSGQNNLQVYPNPIGSQFYVYMRNFSSSSGNILLYNMAGQLVYSQKITLVNGSEFLVVPSEKLSSGVYTLRIITSNGIQVSRKLVK